MNLRHRPGDEKKRALRSPPLLVGRTNLLERRAQTAVAAGLCLRGSCMLRRAAALATQLRCEDLSTGRMQRWSIISEHVLRALDLQPQPLQKPDPGHAEAENS